MFYRLLVALLYSLIVSQGVSNGDEKSCFTDYWVQMRECVGESKLGLEDSKKTCAGALPLPLPFKFVTAWEAKEGGCRKSGSLVEYTAHCCGIQIFTSGHGSNLHGNDPLKSCTEDPMCNFEFTATGLIFLVVAILFSIAASAACCWIFCIRNRMAPARNLQLDDDEGGVELGVVDGPVDGKPKSWIRRTVNKVPMPYWGVKKSLVFPRDKPIPVDGMVDNLRSSLIDQDPDEPKVDQEPDEPKDDPQEEVEMVPPEPELPEPEEPEEPEPLEPEEPEEPEEVIFGRSLEEECTKWLERLSGETRDDREFGEWLKDGQVLCKAANVVVPGSVKKINTQKMPFKQMENITNFIGVCRKLGVLEKDLFTTVCLYEEKNLQSVQNCIYNLASIIRTTAPDFKGPYLGVRQKAQVKDEGREKHHVDLSVGLRKDVAKEVKDATKKGRVAGHVSKD